MLEIDGSMGEGGGAVLRNALALSAVGQRPIRVFNIRAKRDRPGLQPQHLTGVQALAKITNAKIDGAQLHSTEVTFSPGPIEGGRYHIDIGTAGSTTLVLQILMPAAAFARGPVHLEIKGGTDNPLAPPIDYLQHVTFPILRRMGYHGEVECLRRGHYPKGGGLVRATVEPTNKLKAIRLTEQGKVLKIFGLAHAVRLPESIAVRIAHSASGELIKVVNSPLDIKSESYPAAKDQHLGPGAGITIWAETDTGAIIGASSLGKPGKPSEEVGREAAQSLITELKTGGAVDSHLTDQLIAYMALAEGASEINSTKLTSHALTNVELVEKILGTRFSIDGRPGNPGSISVSGLAIKNNKTIQN